MKQIKFYDSDNDTIHSGILTDDGNIICGCCGGLIEKGDIGEGFVKIIKIYNHWVNLDSEILGDDFNNEKDDE